MLHKKFKIQQLPDFNDIFIICSDFSNKVGGDWPNVIDSLIPDIKYKSHLNGE